MDSIKGTADKLAKDLRAHWLRYGIECAIILVLIWPLVEYYRYIRIERLEDELSVMTVQRDRAQQALAETSQCPPATAPSCPPDLCPACPTTDCSAEADLAKKLRGQLETARQQLSDARASLAQCLEPSKPGASAENAHCPELKSAAMGLLQARSDASVIDPDDHTAMSSVRESIEGHMGNLQRWYPDDAVIEQASRRLGFFTEPPSPLINQLLVQLNVYTESDCPAVAALINDAQTRATPSADQRCAQTRALIENLRTLDTQANKGSALTSKDHLVTTFNELLDEAKKLYADDTFVSKQQPLRNQYWHADTKRRLQAAVTDLMTRALSYSANCASSTAANNQTGQ